MSVRHFTRVFTAEVGETPGRFVERMRLEAARRELETTADTLDVVAARCGLGSAETLRRVFQRPLACPPDAYRRRFRTATDAGKDVRMTTDDHSTDPSRHPALPDVTALDAVGPYEVLQRIPTLDVAFVGHDAARFAARTACSASATDATFEEVRRPTSSSSPAASAPGRSSTTSGARVGARAHADTRFTTSVCTGSLVLGAAGLLEGLTATTHWSCYRELGHTARDPRPERVVEHLDDRIITAAGVSSGIDMALRLVELLVDRTAGRGGTADDRVRPPAAIRLRVGGQGGRRGHDPRPGIRRTAGVTR